MGERLRVSCCRPGVVEAVDVVAAWGEGYCSEGLDDYW